MAVVITVDGVDISNDVLYSKSSFITNANGQPGTCSIVLRDAAHSRSFVIGKRILLTIDGLNTWAGYLMRTKRIYPFDDTSPATRWFELIGQDINILFSKRVVRKIGDQAKAGPTYPAYTDDTTVFADLFADYLSLSGDDIDVTTLVSHVASINEDQNAAPIVCGQPWVSTMQQMHAMTGAVWYINPDRKLVWADVDVEDAPFGISDNPGVGQIGVRELVITRDGTDLINDVLFVGAGNGTDDLVYKRLVDTPSVLSHRRWQSGGLVSGVWKQKTINRVADGVIYGSDNNRRGHKDDLVYASCATYTPGLRVGQRVELTSEVYGFTDVIPIRQMRVSWGNSTSARYDLLLSHEYDTLSFFDPYKIPPVDVPDPVIDPPGGGGTDQPMDPDQWYWRVESGQGTDPGVNWVDYFTNRINDFVFYVPNQTGSVVNFDLFTRTEASGWGTSTDGHTWTGVGSPDNDGELSVNGSEGKMLVEPTGSSGWKNLAVKTNPDGPWSNPSWDLLMSFESDWSPNTPEIRTYYLGFGMRSAVDHSWSRMWKIYWNGYGEGVIVGPGGEETPITIDPDNPNTVEVQVRGDGDGDGDPDWCIKVNGVRQCKGDEPRDGPHGGGGGGGSCCGELDMGTSSAGDVSFTQSVVIDDFSRTEASGWGYTPSGAPWTPAYGGTGAASVNGSTGLLSGNSASMTVNLPAADALEYVITFSPISDVGAMTFFFWSSSSSDPMASFDFILTGTDAGKVIYVNGSPSGWFSDDLYADYVLTPGSAYKVRMRYNGANGKLRVWPSSNAEPATWLIDHDYAYQGTTPIDPGVTKIKLSQSGSSTSQSSYDDLIVYHDLTSYGGQDDFDRTVSGNWGTGPIGLWMTAAAATTPSEPEGYVDGTSGVIDYLLTGGSYTWADDPSMGLTLINGGETPHEDADEWSDTTPGIQLPWQATFRATFTSMTNPTYSKNFGMVLNVYLTRRWGVNSVGVGDWVSFEYYTDSSGYPFYIPTGYIYGGMAYQDTADWFAGADWGSEQSFVNERNVGYTPGDPFTFLSRIQVTESYIAMRMWPDGEAEPSDWNYYVSGSFGPSSMWHYFVFESLEMGSLKIDGLTVDPGMVTSAIPGSDGGGPCLWIDDFGRTEAGGWGTNADYGGNWEVVSSTADDTEGVTDGVAWINMPDSPVSSAGMHLYNPNSIYAANGFMTWMGEFNITNDLDKQITWGISDAAPGTGNTDSIRLLSSTVGSINPYQAVSFDAVKNVNYTWRWEYGKNGLTAPYSGDEPVPGVHRFKIWRSDEPEPSSWMIDAGRNWVWLNPNSRPYISAYHTSTGAGKGYQLNVLWTSFSRCEGSSVGESTIPTSGRICENYAGGASVFRTSREYRPGSVDVWVNGTYQHDFTESSETTITLGFSTTTRDSVKICYTIQPPGGGGSGRVGGGNIPV